jgi:hypothetical protein
MIVYYRIMEIKEDFKMDAIIKAILEWVRKISFALTVDLSKLSVHVVEQMNIKEIPFKELNGRYSEAEFIMA